MAWPGTLQIALKEWAVVCRALETGRQIILLRKGGIYESAGEFEIEHRQFLLFPTYLHQKPGMVKADIRGEVETAAAEPAVVSLTLGGEITDIVAMPSRAAMDALDDQHIWTPPLIDMRFAYRLENPLYLLLVRAYRLAEAVAVDNTPAYAGCKSWVPLERPLAVGDALGVLDDNQYDLRRDAILREDRSRQGVMAMEYRRLGDAGAKLSEIGLGGWLTFGNALEESLARAIMNKALELGINFLDTADGYASGRCEEVWGLLLKDRRRSSYVLATKVFFPSGEGPNDSGLSRKHIMEQCHGSLKRLRTDYIDVYQCHRFDENTPLEETIHAMDDLIHQGKVLYWGFSEWPVEQVEKCLQICGDRLYKPKSSQPRYHALYRTPEEKLFPLCHRAGIGQVVFSPLAQGVLTGKYKPNQPLPVTSRAADERQNYFIKPMVNDAAMLAKVQKLIPLAQEEDCTMSQLALAWVLRRAEVTSCIVGATRPEQLEENAKASGIKLAEKTIHRINEILS